MHGDDGRAKKTTFILFTIRSNAPSGPRLGGTAVFAAENNVDHLEAGGRWPVKSAVQSDGGSMRAVPGFQTQTFGPRTSREVRSTPAIYLARISCSLSSGRDRCRGNDHVAKSTDSRSVRRAKMVPFQIRVPSIHDIPSHMRPRRPPRGARAFDNDAGSAFDVGIGFQIRFEIEVACEEMIAR
jgi:hypothetical protein